MTINNPVAQTEELPASRKLGLELRKRPTVVVGGLPTVSLLPREVLDAARGKAIRRGLVAGVVAAAVIAGGATAAAAAVSAASQARLDAANARTQSLVLQLAKFRDLEALQQQIAVGNAAVQVGSSTEVDWQGQIDAIEADMPAGFTVTSIVTDSATPIEAYTQGSTPLDAPRAATVQLSTTADDITHLPHWLHALRSLPAYADATASVSAGDTSGYKVQIVLHLSKSALIASGKAAK